MFEFNNIRELDESDKNYWLIKWKRKKLLDMFWERIYADGDMSWFEILEYIDSGDFKKDVIQDIFNIASNKYDEKNNYI